VERGPESSYMITSSELSAPLHAATEKEGVQIAVKYSKKLGKAYTGRTFFFGLHPDVRKTIAGSYEIAFQLDI